MSFLPPPTNYQSAHTSQTKIQIKFRHSICFFVYVHNFAAELCVCVAQKEKNWFITSTLDNVADRTVDFLSLFVIQDWTYHTRIIILTLFVIIIAFWKQNFNDNINRRECEWMERISKTQFYTHARMQKIRSSPISRPPLFSLSSSRRRMKAVKAADFLIHLYLLNKKYRTVCLYWFTYNTPYKGM